MVKTMLPQNENLKKNIFDRFYWDTRVESSNIDVEVSEGHVTLVGSVPTNTARRAAEADALSVPGVRSLKNQLKIKFSSHFKIPSDLEVESNIRDIIRWNSHIDSSKLTITVVRGYVTLEGIVSSYYQKHRIRDLTSDVIGVLEIDDRITVVPLSVPSDRELADNVIATLHNELGSDANSLTVMVRTGIVTLTGTMPDRLAFNAAENTIRHLRGVVDVHNHLAIREGEPPGGHE